MKEFNNTDMNSKVQYSPPAGGAGGNYRTFSHYQQLPITVFVSRLKVQPLIEKITCMVMSFHYKRFALVRL